MKRKLIILFVLSILILTLTVGTVGVAFADEIRINLLGDEFTLEEKELAIANLKLKFEDKEMPTLKSVEKLYDFNEEPLYGLYEFEDYYMIVIRQTSSILERGEGNSAYFEVEGKKYYGGLNKAFILTDNGYKSLTSKKNTYANQEEIEEMKDNMAELRTLDYQDYIEALNTPMPLGQGNRNRITKLGNNSNSYNYFAQEVNIYHRYVNYPNEFAQTDYFGVLYEYAEVDEKEYGSVFLRNFNYGYDLFYPKNVYNACSLVAMVMVLQYYDRMGYNKSLVPFTFGEGYSLNTIKNNPLYSRAEHLRDILDNYIKVLQTGVSSTDGAATYVNINGAFKRYFEAYNINCKSTYFTSYTNIKKAINSGNPAIMTVGAGSGWDINNIEVGISLHNLVVYGYTTNSIGVLDEFVCHANWHELPNKYNGFSQSAMLFVNKFYAAGNVYIEGI